MRWRDGQRWRIVGVVGGVVCRRRSAWPKNWRVVERVLTLERVKQLKKRVLVTFRCEVGLTA